MQHRQRDALQDRGLTRAIGPDQRHKWHGPIAVLGGAEVQVDSAQAAKCLNSDPADNGQNRETLARIAHHVDVARTAI